MSYQYKKRKSLDLPITRQILQAHQKERRIRGWKKQDIRVLHDDWDAFYTYYQEIKRCQKCRIKFKDECCPQMKVVDHDHYIKEGDNVRAIICLSCNSKLPKQLKCIETREIGTQTD